MPRNEMRAPPVQQHAQVRSEPMPRNEMRAPPPQPQRSEPRPPSGNYAAMPHQAPEQRQAPQPRQAPPQNGHDNRDRNKDHRE
jgi:hypothetical protein